MKKILLFKLFTCLFCLNLFSQSFGKEKFYINQSIIKKPNKDLISNEPFANTDSTFRKTKNGFDIKESKVDNMQYLMTNKENIANKKMQIDNRNGDAKIPTKRLPIMKNNFIKQSQIATENITDSINK